MGDAADGSVEIRDSLCPRESGETEASLREVLKQPRFKGLVLIGETAAAIIILLLFFLEYPA